MNKLKEDKFRITIIARAKHGVLYEAIKKRAWTQRRAAEFLGVSEQGLGNAINLKGVMPYLFSKKRTKKTEAHARAVAEKLMELTGKTVEELFPREVMTKQFLAAPKLAERSVDVPTRLLLEQAELLALPPAPDQLLMAKEEMNEFIEMLNELGHPQRHAMQRVIIDGVSVSKAANERGITNQAIRANINTGICELRRKLEHRKKRGELESFKRKHGFAPVNIP